MLLKGGTRGARREVWRGPLSAGAFGAVAVSPVAMLRRKPTRLELKLDDIEEFESVRKELEVRAGPGVGGSARPRP